VFGTQLFYRVLQLGHDERKEKLVGFCERVMVYTQDRLARTVAQPDFVDIWPVFERLGVRPNDRMGFDSFRFSQVGNVPIESAASSNEI